MKYELDFIYRMICGDLSPDSDPGSTVADHLTFLQDRFGQCVKHYKIHFKSTSTHQYQLENYKEYAFLDISGLIYINDPSSDVEEKLLEKLLSLALTQIPVDKENITQAHIKTGKKEIYLEVTATSSFQALKVEEARFHYYRTLLHDEVERIKQSFHQQAFRLQSQKQIELFIQNHQLALENIIQYILNFLDEQERKNLYSLSELYSLTDLYKTFYHYLEKIQRHIERYFTKYLAIDASMPYRSRLLSSVEMDKKIQFVSRHLMESNLDEKLLKMIDKLLTKLAHITPDERFTYQALIYHKKVLDELYTTTQTSQQKLSNEMLVEILYRLNFNSIDFFHFITTFIERRVAAVERYEDKQALLYYYQKMYRQRPIKTHMFYQKGLLPIRRQILNWLKEEIYYLKKIAESKAVKPVKENRSDPNKITTQMSVAQLAYILKVMHETGLITAKSQWDMFRFLQENVSSKRKETVSAQSLNNKYYNVEAATKSSVKELLLKMLHHMNKAK